ncbi:hypothetical protein [Nitrolancea hollandica]|uniref:Uncharacterized protein n=1 Tax=Nitrolancea hollandica Lb TaxID=1129897 RepID=I4EFL9_9BACT|nr:hypothetical protein [Nitrolancea hollandica]CCF83481.1 hypothetical protein NITHO_2310024 [Nitrolancea hollandica Lb]
MSESKVPLFSGSIGVHQNPDGTFTVWVSDVGCTCCVTETDAFVAAGQTHPILPDGTTVDFLPVSKQDAITAMSFFIAALTDIRDSLEGEVPPFRIQAG